MTNLLKAMAGAAGGSAAGGYEVENSVRLDDNSSAYMSKTFSGAADSTTTYTLSLWFKRGNISLGATTRLLTANGVSDMTIGILSDDTLTWSDQETDAPYDTWYLTTTQVLRDPAAWYNLVLCFDSTNGTAGNRMRMWLNGVEVTDFDTDTNPDLNANSAMGSAIEHFIGSWNASLQYFDGYISEFVYLDGAAVTDATDFGEFDDQSEWRPKDVTGLEFGNGGFLLDMAKAEGTDNGAGEDVSGNANHFTTSGITASDTVTDTCTDNHATWNSINLNNSMVLSDGNLVCTDSDGVNEGQALSTLPMTSNDKVHAEFTVTANTVPTMGIMPASTSHAATSSAKTIKNQNTGYGYSSGGEKIELSTDTGSAGATYTSGDRIGFEYDGTAGTLEAFKDGATQFTITGIDTDINWVWAADMYGNGKVTANFGQQDFTDTPTTGFTANSTSNMTALTFDPTAHVQPHTYDGTGSAKDETFTGASNLTSTDLVIIKNRDTADSAIFIDRVRGATKEIRFAAGSTSEATDPNGLDDLDVSNGFGLGTGAGGYNDSGEAFSAIGFYLDGTTGSTNNVGTIESVVSANDVSGVSVVKVVSGGGVAGTIGHGLTTEPGFILAKNLGSGAQGRYSSDAIGWTKGMYFPGGSAPTTGSGYFNDAAPGTARNYTFSVGTDDETSGSGDTIIYYCFASKPGVSYVESFTGNNSTDGSVINMGFKPSVVLLILASAGQMFWFDDLRDTYNAATNTQDLDGLSAEGTEGPIDFLSNGVKLRFAGGPNSGTNTIIAFARQPTLNKSGTPAKAR